MEELAPTLGVWGEGAGERERGGVNSPESPAVPPGTQLSLPTVKVKSWELPPSKLGVAGAGRSQGTRIQMDSLRTRQTRRQASRGAGSPLQTHRALAGPLPPALGAGGAFNLHPQERGEF